MRKYSGPPLNALGLRRKGDGPEGRTITPDIFFFSLQWSLSAPPTVRGSPCAPAVPHRPRDGKTLCGRLQAILCDTGY